MQLQYSFLSIPSPFGSTSRIDGSALGLGALLQRVDFDAGPARRAAALLRAWLDENLADLGTEQVFRGNVCLDEGFVRIASCSLKRIVPDDVVQGVN